MGVFNEVKKKETFMELFPLWLRIMPEGLKK